MAHTQKYQIEFHKGGITIWSVDGVPGDPSGDEVECEKLKRYDYSDPEVSQLTIERVTRIDRGGRSGRSGILLTAEGIQLKQDDSSGEPVTSQFESPDEIVSANPAPRSEGADTESSSGQGDGMRSDNQPVELAEIFPSLEDDEEAVDADKAEITSDEEVMKSTDEEGTDSVTGSTTNVESDVKSEGVDDTTSSDTEEDDPIDRERLESLDGDSEDQEHQESSSSSEPSETDDDSADEEEEEQLLTEEEMSEFAEKGLR